MDTFRKITSLPSEVILNIAEYGKLSDFFKTTYVDKEHNIFIQKTTNI